MNSAVDLYRAIQQVSANTMEVSKPTEVVYGTVSSIEPLKIRLDQKLLLTEKFLIIPKEFKDFETEITINGKREKVIIHNSFKIGEKLALLRNNKGQRFFILGRV